jgi:hypothetical protein
VRTRKIFLHLRVDVLEEGAKKHVVLWHWHVHSESIDLHSQCKSHLRSNLLKIRDSNHAYP